MTEEYNRFCVRCGANLPDNATFCPKCGSPADGSEPADKTYYGNNCGCPYGSCSSGLGSVPVFILLYVVASMIYSLMYLVMGFTMNSELWTMLEESAGAGVIGMTMEQFKTIAIAGGVCGLVSGFTAFIAYRLVKNNTKVMIAVAMCVISAFASIGLFMEMALLTCPVGLYMAYRIYKNKNCFDS